MPIPSLPCRQALIALMLVAGMLIVSSASHAQTSSTLAAVQPTPSSSDTIRLTDEERKTIADNTTLDSAAAARGEMTGSERASLGIHGEVGALIGSNGTRAAYGTAAIPLGDHAGAVVSFESSRSGYRR